MKYLIGIDEVGRGPLAGPVAVGIVVISKENYQAILMSGLFYKNKDSKKLTPKRREKTFEIVVDLKKQGKLNYGVFFESNFIIDQLGIATAIRRAIAKGLKNLKMEPADCRVLLDGGLKCPLEYSNQESLIKGDETELVISLASVVAKVTRDRKMEILAEDTLLYDFKNNKGYGTVKHIADLKKYGPSNLHRKSFITRIIP